MKTFTTVVIVILVLLVAGTVFIVLNRPANLLIRKAFKTVTGIEFIKASENAAKDALILNLTTDQQQSKAREDSLLNLVSVIDKDSAIKDLRIKSLESRVVVLNAELDSAQSIFQILTKYEKTAEFDRKTAGNKATFIAEYEGHEVAMVEPERIFDATWKIHQGEVAHEIVQTQVEQIDVMHKKITMVETANKHLKSAINECHNQNAAEIQKREICEKSVNDAMKKAKGIAAGGGLALVLAIALAIL